MSELDRVNKKVREDGYVFAKKLPQKQDGKNVYIPYGKMFIGYPILYVVDKNGEISENPDLWKSVDIEGFEPKFTEEEYAILKDNEG